MSSCTTPGGRVHVADRCPVDRGPAHRCGAGPLTWRRSGVVVRPRAGPYHPPREGRSRRWSRAVRVERPGREPIRPLRRPAPSTGAPGRSPGAL